VQFFGVASLCATKEMAAQAALGKWTPPPLRFQWPPCAHARGTSTQVIFPIAKL
jgi:hypothetical protein